MMSYHELAAGNRNPHQFQQFLVASAIAAALLLHSSLSAGLLAPLSITETKDTHFPGGTFVYKSMMKDYAASFGTWRTIDSDLDRGGGGGLLMDGKGERDEEEGLFHTIFMDDESLIPGGKTRFASGVLLTKQTKDADGIKKWLLDTKNNEIDLKVKEEITIPGGEKGDGDYGGRSSHHSKYIRYEVTQLPKVKAAVAYHPFNDGMWSTVLQSFKVKPLFLRIFFSVWIGRVHTSVKHIQMPESSSLHHFSLHVKDCTKIQEILC